MEGQSLPTLIKKSSLYKIVITDDVEEKIRFLCSKIPDVEWSGVLFYTHEGSIEQGNLVITCVDIYVMDIGTGTYTEFDMSPEVISYMCESDHLMDTHTGLIHSHNKMDTFFSGTDLSTLKSEGNDRNHFVSLIVNNDGKYTAAITRKVKYVKTVDESYSYGSFDDTQVSGTGSYIKEEEFIEYFDLEIVKKCSSASFDSLEKRLDEIRNRKSKSSCVAKPVTKPLGDRYFDKDQQFLISKRELGEMTAVPHHEKPTVPYHITDDTLESILIQMLTGSILIKNPSSIDIEKWVLSMSDVYGSRFGLDEQGLSDFRQWADSHCEFLIFNSIPEGLSACEESDLVSNIATCIYEELDSLPQNKYINIFKEIIEQWIL